MFELKHVLGEDGDENLEPLLNAFKQVDGDKDGRLNFDEFKQILEKAPSDARLSLKNLMDSPSKSVNNVFNDNDRYDQMAGAQHQSNAKLALLDVNSNVIHGS